MSEAGTMFEADVTRICCDCGQTKPRSGFYSTRVRSGHRCFYRRCKPCHLRIQHERQVARVGRRRCSACGGDEARGVVFHAAASNHRCVECTVKARTTRLYGVDFGALTEMLDAQGGRCAVCRKPIQFSFRAGKKRPDTVNVDHCHASGKVRGLLCGPCNSGIGLLRDDPTTVRAAAAYLEQ